jgi:hypothetical protein
MAIKRIGKGFQFGSSQAAFKVFQRTAPKKVANNSLNHFLKGFRQGGKQTDASKSGWQARQTTAKRNQGRGILIDTGALRRSIKVLKSTWKEIIIGSQGIAYAARHNEGLKGMPQREFVGDSKDLDESNKKLLKKLLIGVFK